MRRTGVILHLALALLTACTVATPPAPFITPSPATAPTSTPIPLTQRDRAGFARQRERMVIETIERRGVTDDDVLSAMRTVPRHLFVPESERDHAYGDYPLPIGYGQTISQPYIVALMTELLELKTGDKVLEIGTGSGYQAAVLAQIPGIEVYTIEIVPELAESAHQRAWPTPKSTASRQMDTMAGPNTLLSTPSSSPPPPITCRSRWRTNWPRGDGW
jgi:hypothetical protein